MARKIEVRIVQDDPATYNRRVVLCLLSTRRKKSVAGIATLNSPKEDGGIVSVSVRSSSPGLTQIQPLKHLIQYVGELLFTNKVKKSNSVINHILY